VRGDRLRMFRGDVLANQRALTNIPTRSFLRTLLVVSIIHALKATYCLPMSRFF